LAIKNFVKTPERVHFFLLFVVHVRTKGIGKVWLKRCTSKNSKEYYGIFLERHVSALMAEALNSPSEEDYWEGRKSNAPIWSFRSFVRKLENLIHWINHYPVDSAIDFPNT